MREIAKDGTGPGDRVLGAWQISAPEPLFPAETGEQPTLSVVIPYYRGAHVIRQAVESALDQTLPPDEIVICDDGSPDDLGAALGELTERVTVVRKENGGAASAMNAAARAASGDFVVQLDQDDAFCPQRLEAIASVAVRRPDVDIVATDAHVEYEGKSVATFNTGIPFQSERQREAILETCFFTWPAIRRSRLLAVGGYDESFKALYDWECFIRLVFDGAVVAHVDGEPLYRWRVSPGSLSSGRRDNAAAFTRFMSSVLENVALSDSERVLVARQFAEGTRWLAAEEARLAIETREGGVRRKSLALVVGRGFSFGARAKGAVAALSPALARRWLTRRSARDPVHDALVRRMIG